jgi:hypothetical protein
MADRSTTRLTSRVRDGAVAGLALLALVAAATPQASAAVLSSKPAAFALSPGVNGGALRLHGVPGRLLHGAVLVRNLSGRPVTVVLQRADIQNSSNGNADFITTHVSHTGRWLHLASSRLRLAPHSVREVTFTVSVPASARGASHYAGIVAINAAELATAAARKPVHGRAFTFHRIDRQALPVTIRLPGRLWRRLVLRSARIIVAPVGAGLVLDMRAGGSELIEATRIKLRVQRQGRTLFTYDSRLGQLFPAAGLGYRIPWRGRPSQGSYHLQGVIRPEGGAAVEVNPTVEFNATKATQLERETTPTVQRSSSSMPGWV